MGNWLNPGWQQVGLKPAWPDSLVRLQTTSQHDPDTRSNRGPASVRLSRYSLSTIPWSIQASATLPGAWHVTT